MQCRELGEALDAAHAGTLDPRRAADLETHLEVCPGCRDLASRERAWIALLRAKLGDAEPECGALRMRITAALEDRDRPRAARVLGSGWVPRLAMAAVLALVALVPLLWLGGGTPARATAAAARYAAHAPSPGGAIPPCCKVLDLSPGDALPAGMADVRLPDLGASGLRFVEAAYCTFGGDPVYALAYDGGAEGRFSLYIGEHGTREFKLMRHETRDGVPQARHVVSVPEEGARPSQRLAVVLWLRRGHLFTWVGADGTRFETARHQLQTTP